MDSFYFLKSQISKKQQFIEFSPLQLQYLREISEIVNLMLKLVSSSSTSTSPLNESHDSIFSGLEESLTSDSEIENTLATIPSVSYTHLTLPTKA